LNAPRRPGLEVKAVYRRKRAYLGFLSFKGIFHATLRRLRRRSLLAQDYDFQSLEKAPRMKIGIEKDEESWAM
jgi:hypothetical protein